MPAMFFITLVEKGGGGEQELTFEKPEVTIGRLAGNDIVLGKGNVSKYHSRFVLKDGKYIVVDMQSTNGTFVNGKKIAAPQVVKPTDKIYIGDYILNVEAPSAPRETRLAEPAVDEGYDEGGGEGGEEGYDEGAGAEQGYEGEGEGGYDPN